MKYILMFVQKDGDTWEKMTPLDQNMPEIGRWFGDHAQAGRLVGGSQLEARTTATTVRWRGDQPVVTDGPFIETKETIGGYGIFEVPDLDTAIAIAKSFPEHKHHAVEIRPLRDNPMRDPRQGQ